MTVLGEALRQLRQEYASQGKTSTFEALKAFLDPNNSIATPSYNEVANRLQVTTGGVKTLIHRLRKRYTALLREEVGRTVSDPAEIDEEIHAPCEAQIARSNRKLWRIGGFGTCVRISSESFSSDLALLSRSESSLTEI